MKIVVIIILTISLIITQANSAENSQLFDMLNQKDNLNKEKSLFEAVISDSKNKSKTPYNTKKIYKFKQDSLEDRENSAKTDSSTTKSTEDKDEENSLFSVVLDNKERKDSPTTKTNEQVDTNSSNIHTDADKNSINNIEDPNSNSNTNQIQSNFTKQLNDNIMSSREKELQKLLQKEKHMRKKENKIHLNIQHSQNQKLSYIEEVVKELQEQNHNLKKLINKKTTQHRRVLKEHENKEGDIINFVEKVGKKVEQVNNSLNNSQVKLKKEIEYKEEKLIEEIENQTNKYKELIKKINDLGLIINNYKTQLNSVSSNEKVEFFNLDVKENLSVGKAAKISKINTQNIMIKNRKNKGLEIKDNNIIIDPSVRLLIGDFNFSSSELASVTDEIKALKIKCGEELVDCVFVKTDSKKNDREIINSIKEIRGNVKKYR